MKKMIFVWSAGLAILLASTACGGDSAKKAAATPSAANPGAATPSTINPATTTGSVNPADFQARVDNRFFSLTPGSRRVYEGEEADSETAEKLKVRVESTVLSQTETIAGIESTVVEVKDFERGQLAEYTRDYYAQHKDGTVYYLGERLDEYEDGVIVGHRGQWLAGEGNNQPGIFMPADPKVNTEFTQEGAQGVAQDRGIILAVDQTVETPAGKFSGCVKINEYDPLEDFSVINYFCLDAGLVHEEPPGGNIDLVSMTNI